MLAWLAWGSGFDLRSPINQVGWHALRRNRNSRSWGSYTGTFQAGHLSVLQTLSVFALKLPSDCLSHSRPHERPSLASSLETLLDPDKVRVLLSKDFHQDTCVSVRLPWSPFCGTHGKELFPPWIIICPTCYYFVLCYAWWYASNLNGLFLWVFPSWGTSIKLLSSASWVQASLLQAARSEQIPYKPIFLSALSLDPATRGAVISKMPPWCLCLSEDIVSFILSRVGKCLCPHISIFDVSVSERLYGTCVWTTAHGGQRWASDLPRLELQAVVSQLMWVLGTHLTSSGSIARALTLSRLSNLPDPCSYCFSTFIVCFYPNMETPESPLFISPVFLLPWFCFTSANF